VRFLIEIEREDDGRWLAEIPALPGVMAYGKTRQEAIAKVEALALRVVADQTEERKTPIKSSRLSFACSR
jgi:predicted RNase H-like HicB family nuclease